MSNYNGWTNYETWSCKMWIDKDHYKRALERQAAKEAAKTPLS